jgi:hypothetical protein
MAMNPRPREETYDLVSLPLLNPLYPLVGSLFYFGGIIVFKRICRLLKTDGTSPQFAAFVFMHNLALCIYSAWTFIYGWKIQLDSFQNRGLFPTWCDYGEVSWNNGMGYFMWLFYLSKYYEFIDTLILIVKGKNPPFLQEYHHVGVVISMWSLTVTRTGLGYWMMLINSGVHTIMYAYYASTVYPLTRNLLAIVKRYITMMQITQFLVAVTFLGSPIILAQVGIYIEKTEEEYLKLCTNTYQRWSIIFSWAYLLPLIILFFTFYANTYTVKPESKILRKGEKESVIKEEKVSVIKEEKVKGE